MSTVRNIGTIMDLGSYKESKLNYYSLESLTKVVCNYIENSEYKDEKFNKKILEKVKKMEIFLKIL